MAGRPTKYDESYVQKVDEYLQVCQDEYEDYHKTVGEKSNTYERKVKVKLPTIEGFALYIDVHKDTIYEWRKMYQAFSDSLDKILLVQRQRLIDSGLSGDYSPVIAKLVLSANHGMREKTDVTTDGKELPQPILNVLPNHSNEQNSTVVQEDSSGTGGDIGQ